MYIRSKWKISQHILILAEGAFLVPLFLPQALEGYSIGMSRD